MEGNAFKFAAELQKKGYKTQVLQPVKGSLFRVVVLPTADEVGEEALLKQVQENIHPQAWILAE
jgi:cell division septation protein DedD